MAKFVYAEGFTGTYNQVILQSSFPIKEILSKVPTIALKTSPSLKTQILKKKKKGKNFQQLLIPKLYPYSLNPLNIIFTENKRCIAGLPTMLVLLSSKQVPGLGTIYVGTWETCSLTPT